MIEKLQYISQGKSTQEHIEGIKRALEGGCGWIQLRLKSMPATEVMKTAKKVKVLCDQHKAKLTINDYPEVAKAINAYGLHLGLGDMPIPQARDIVGHNIIIGGSANTYEDILQRVSEKADYIGLGPYRITATKKALSPILGLIGYQEILNKLVQEQISSPPILAIGGIVEEDVLGIIDTGIYGIAVSSVITKSNDPKKVINTLTNDLYEKTINHS